MKRMLALGKWFVILGLIAAAIGVVGCSSTSSATTAPNTGLITNPGGTTSTSGGAVTINISAKNMSFDTNKLTVQAGAKVTLVFANNDAGIPHNVAFYTDSTAAKIIFQGQTINGVSTVSYQFTAPSAPGTYFFRCDVHPTIMTGDFVVTPITQ
jgi:plastocyanin